MTEQNPLKILITGASGFVGRYVVGEALKRGHSVKAVARSPENAKSLDWFEHANVELCVLDLLQQPQLTEALGDVDLVIHLAAAKEGDFYEQFSGTVLATEKLLAAMAEANVKRLIAISTFSIYEFKNRPTNALLDEDSPLVEDPLKRDGYTQTKLLQEQLYRKYADEQGGEVTILRPGMIYGREYLWHALLGAEIGNTLLRIGSNSTLPLSYVENCADAILDAAESASAIGQTLNIVDDNLPTQRDYVEELKRHTEPPKLKYMPWFVADGLARLAWWFNKTFLGGKALMPGILVPVELHARFKPLRYSNSRAKQMLGWTPKYSFRESLQRSCSREAESCPEAKS